MTVLFITCHILFVLGRNSVDQPTFPRKGSNMKLSIQLTPPYSVLDGIDEYSESEIDDLNHMGRIPQMELWR